jgi:hypothetical protein
MDDATVETIAMEQKTETAPHPAAPMNKLAANRKANKERKKRAHRRKLRRSNTKG